MFMFDSRTRFHFDGSIGLCGTRIKLKNKGSIHMATCYFTFYKDITLTKIAHFSKRHYHLSFCGVKVSGDSVARYSQVCSSAMLLLLM
jgi:hypothetical protein